MLSENTPFDISDKNVVSQWFISYSWEKQEANDFSLNK